MATDNTKLATFKLEPDIWEAFKDLCNKSDISASRALTRFIKSSLEAGELGEHIITPAPDELQPTPQQPVEQINIEELEARLLSVLEAKFNELQTQPTVKKQKAVAARRGRS